MGQAGISELGPSAQDSGIANDDATAAWDSYGHVVERAHALFGLGRCANSLGDSRAEAVLAASAEVFTQLQASPLAARVSRELTRAMTR